MAKSQLLHILPDRSFPSEAAVKLQVDISKLKTKLANCDKESETLSREIQDLTVDSSQQVRGAWAGLASSLCLSLSAAYRTLWCNALLQTFHLGVILPPPLLLEPHQLQEVRAQLMSNLAELEESLAKDKQLLGRLAASDPARYRALCTSRLEGLYFLGPAAISHVFV